MATETSPKEKFRENCSSPNKAEHASDLEERCHRVLVDIKRAGYLEIPFPGKTGEESLKEAKRFIKFMKRNQSIKKS